MAGFQDEFTLRDPLELGSGLEVKKQKQTLEELMNEFMLENMALGPELPLIPFTCPVTCDKWLIIQTI